MAILELQLQGSRLLEKGIEQIQSRLPKAWELSLLENPELGPFLELKAPDGRVVQLRVEAKVQLDPKGAYELWGRVSHGPLVGQVLVIAPYLSAKVRDKLVELGWCYTDLTGNIRIELSEPGLFILTDGATANPFPEARRTRTLKGAKASRIVRALIDVGKLWKIRDLAEAAETDPGYVSRVLQMLERQALITRDDRGRLLSVDWQGLLRYWAEEAPLEARGPQTACIAPRGLADLQKRLRETSLRYAITGELVAAHFAPIAPPRLATVYVDSCNEASQELGLRETKYGANVLLIEATEASPFLGAREESGLSFVALSQAAADLLTSPGRGPAEGEELIKWMEEHEEMWRGE